MNLALIEKQVKTIVMEIAEAADLGPRRLLIVGCSTSEVQGKRIGKAGSEEIAKAIFQGIYDIQLKYGFSLAFQSCEHINRAIVIERETQQLRNLEEVSVIPAPSAGGSMSAYAYTRFHDPVAVERIQAEAGIDIGDTFIGMHLKPVAVPIRPGINCIGHAHVTAARTRPRYIGGPRAVYPKNEDVNVCT